MKLRLHDGFRRLKLKKISLVFGLSMGTLFLGLLGYKMYITYKYLHPTTEFIRSLLAKQMISWQDEISSELSLRMTWPDNDLQNLLFAMGYDDVIELNEEEINDFLTRYWNFLDLLSSKLIQSLSEKVFAIIPVHRLGISGLAIPVLKNDKAKGGIILLDIDRISRPISDWFVFAESRGFTDDCSFQIKSKLSDGTLDATMLTLGFVFMHEAMHLLTMDTQILEDYSLGEGYLESHWNDFFYQNISWFLTREKRIERKDREVQELMRYVALDGSYDKGSDCKKLPALFKSLETSDFVDLYSAQSPEEDFAESGATYFFAKKLHQPIKIWLEEDGKIISEVAPCWGAKRCKEKEAFFEGFFNHKS